MTMMTLEFDINDPDDARDARVAFDGERYLGALCDIDEFLRQGIKYNDKPWQEIRDELYSILEEQGVSLDLG